MSNLSFLGVVYRPLWRVFRGLTMGAQGVVLDAEERVLLVRHTYRPGWHFPGGGVEWGETVEAALARELHEEAGATLTGPPVLHGIFANFAKFPGDHIALYVVRRYARPVDPPPSAEIAESRFFARSGLPAGVTPPALRRLAEVLDGAPRTLDW